MLKKYMEMCLITLSKCVITAILFFVVCGHTSETFFFHLDEKIILCSQKCDLEYKKEYNNVLLVHKGTSIYLIGTTKDIIKFLYDSRFLLKSMIKKDINGITEKYYEYKLNNIIASNEDYLLWQKTNICLLPEDVLAYNERMIFTISVRKVIKILK